MSCQRCGGRMVETMAYDEEGRAGFRQSTTSTESSCTMGLCRYDAWVCPSQADEDGKARALPLNETLWSLFSQLRTRLTCRGYSTIRRGIGGTM